MREPKSTFRIKSAYAPQVPSQDKSKETLKQHNLKQQRSLKDSITQETKMLKCDYIEKYEIINK